MNSTAFKQLATVDPDWWRGAAIYQIYPRSFQDDSGDGVGDLAGITRRLPYVASLGVDAIWISPFFVSPMLDFGYDISDYCNVDPLFGDLDDFDTLIETAHTLGVRVMIDLVISHTSSEHPWFIESSADKGNDKSDWYVWADCKPDGSPPNNWLSIFGGSAWQWNPGRQQYYLHNFLSEQPDLNLHNAQVQESLLTVTQFWLDRGVDGFRQDTINFYFHDRALRDNPPLPVEERESSIAPRVNPYTFQRHLYDKNQPENIAFLERLRALMDNYPGIAAVGEVGDDQRGLELMGEYTAGDNRMHMCYAFDFLAEQPLTAARVEHILQQYALEVTDGWGCWAFSNHDVVRHPTRWNLNDAGMRCHAELLFCLRGSVCIYQGEELGFEEAILTREQLRDPYGITFWPAFKGRDGCRTPMAWSKQQGNDDFSNTDTWLPVAPQQRLIAVDQQLHDQHSLLAHYRHCIQLRKDHPALAKGELEGLNSTGTVLQFQRTMNGERLLCVFNLSQEETSVAQLPEGHWRDIRHGKQNNLAAKTISLAPWQVLIAKESL